MGLGIKKASSYMRVFDPFQWKGQKLSLVKNESDGYNKIGREEVSAETNIVYLEIFKI